MRASKKKPLGVPTSDPRAQQALVLRSLKDKRKWAPVERCSATVVTVAATGGGTDSMAHVYIEFDIARNGQIERIATGDRVDRAHLAQLEPGRTVTVFVDTEHLNRVGIAEITPQGQ